MPVSIRRARGRHLYAMPFKGQRADPPATGHSGCKRQRSVLVCGRTISGQSPARACAALAPRQPGALRAACGGRCGKIGFARCDDQHCAVAQRSGGMPSLTGNLLIRNSKLIIGWTCLMVRTFCACAIRGCSSDDVDGFPRGVTPLAIYAANSSASFRFFAYSSAASAALTLRGTVFGSQIIGR